MDESLHNRLQLALPPFDGNCLHLTDQVSLSLLRETLATVADRLRAKFGSQMLLHLDDWHQHDGFLTGPVETDWDRLYLAFENETSLAASRHGDFDVRLAYYPRDLSFLLRYYVDDDEIAGQPEKLMGDFDLCGPDEFLCTVRESVFDRIGDVLIESNAKEYFDRIDAG